MRRKNINLKFPRFLIWFGIGILFSFITSLVLISFYTGVNVDNEQLLTIYFYLSLVVGLVFAMSSKGKAAFGHLPFLGGWFLFLWAGLLLWGNVELTTFEKDVWWEIPEFEVKKWLALATFIGLGFGLWGTKILWGILPFARPFGKGGR